MSEDAPWSRNSILLIDDEPLVLKAVSRVLAKVGYDVRTRSTAEEGLAALAEHPFLAVITDLKMPGLGGHHFIRNFRHVAPSTPVIVISGHGDIDDVIECFREGATDYVQKPFSDGELRTALRRVLDRIPADAAGSAASQRAPGAGSRPCGSTAAPGVVDNSAQFVGVRSTASAPAPAALQADLAVATGRSNAAPGLETGEVPEERVANPGPASTRPADPGGLAGLLRRIRSGELPLPAVPAVAIAVRRVLADPEPSLKRLSELIEQDASLVGRILKVVNGTYYAGYGRVTDIRAAIARVGLREVAQLVDAVSAHRLYSGTGLPAGLLLSLWQRSWARAVAMRVIATENPALGVNSDSAYLAGLFADVGAPFLLKAIPEIAPQSAPTEMMSFVAAHHAEVGASIAVGWGLPVACVEAARDHHRVVEPEIASPLIQLLAAADAILATFQLEEQLAPLPLSATVLDYLRVVGPTRDLYRARIENYVKTHRVMFEAGSED